jgi:hypothetical protein
VLERVSAFADPSASTSVCDAPAPAALASRRLTSGRYDAHRERDDHDDLVIHQTPAGQGDDVVHSKLGWIGREECRTRIRRPDSIDRSQNIADQFAEVRARGDQSSRILRSETISVPVNTLDRGFAPTASGHTSDKVTMSSHVAVQCRVRNSGLEVKVWTPRIRGPRTAP